MDALLGKYCVKNVSLFDVATSNFVMTVSLHVKSITMASCDKNLNLVSSDADLPVVSIAERSMFLPFENFVNQRLNAKVRVLYYGFSGKI